MPIPHIAAAQPQQAVVLQPADTPAEQGGPVVVTTGQCAARFYCTIPMCQKRYTTKFDLKRLAESVHEGKKFTCSTCGLIFTLKKKLVLHMNLHGNSVDNICQVCGKACTDKRGLASHLAGHSGEKNFPCTNAGCTKAYQNNSSLRKHLKVCGKSIEERQQYSCPHCSQKCVRKDTPKDHIDTVHGEQGKFVCPMCGYAMNSRGALKSHKCKA